MGRRERRVSEDDDRVARSLGKIPTYGSKAKGTVGMKFGIVDAPRANDGWLLKNCGAYAPPTTSARLLIDGKECPLAGDVVHVEGPDGADKTGRIRVVDCSCVEWTVGVRTFDGEEIDFSVVSAGDVLVLDVPSGFRDKGKGK